MILSICLAGLLVIILWLVLEKPHQLDHLDGPKRLPIIGSIFISWGLNQGQLFLLTRDLCKTYKDRFFVKIFRRRILHIYNPDDVAVVLSHTKNISKSFHYSLLEPWLGTGLLISTGNKWHQRRKILTPTFHFNILRNFFPVMAEKSEKLVKLLLDHQGQEIDVVSAISDFTLNTICETAMGVQLDSNKSAETAKYKKSILEIGRMYLKRLVTFYLHNEFIFRLSKTGKTFYNNLKVLQGFADDVIVNKKNQRLNSGESSASESVDDILTKKRLALMDLLLDAEDRGQIDLEGIKEEVNTFMFEGHDTTAMGLSFCLMLLAEHPDVQDKIYEEQQSIFTSNRRVEMSDLTNMKYLEAVIKETLRLYPSVPFISRKITEDFTLGNNINVPKGTEIAVHIYELHRQPNLYPEPEAFKPERFLTNDITSPFAFVPFSAGPRNCIGQKFAMLEMKCVLSEICRSLKMTSRCERPAMASDLVLRPIGPIYVSFHKRSM